MTRAIEGFTGLEHALEPVGHVGGVQFVNDSKATNIEAARRAIEAFESGLVVIMGGRFKGGDFGDLAPALVARHAVVVAIGEARPLIHEALGDRVQVLDAGDMAAAVRRAFAAAPPAVRWCWRRRAPASTCSATTQSAAACSSRSCRGCGLNGKVRANSEQSSVRSVR